MSYQEYVLGAYAVFAVYLLWDYLVPRWQLRNTLRQIALRAKRDAAAKQGSTR